MDRKKAGVVLLVIGVILLAVGFQEFGAFGSSLSRAVGRGPSNRAVVFLIGGGVCAALGAMRLFRK